MKIPQKLVRENIIEITLILSDKEYSKYKELGMEKSNVYSLNQTQKEGYIGYLGKGELDSKMFQGNGVTYIVNEPSNGTIIYTILFIRINDIQYPVIASNMKLKYEYLYKTKSAKNSTFFKWIRELAKEGLLNFTSGQHLQSQKDINNQVVTQDQINEGNSELVEGIDAGNEYPEGEVAFAIHRTIERDYRLIKDAKEKFLENHGRLYCEACGFDFEHFYGNRGSKFIEGHHTKLVSEMNGNYKSKIEDIAMLCSNCHSMIHRKPLLSVKRLKQLIDIRK
ncbi:HNH endonuclease [Paenibacillus sp. FSL H7-0690]|uniref:HNH endonuclease n=1 Tax=Paenibacillus sp. FSL H7-0690 TaxID=2921437 RepID=UPI0030EDC00D